MGAAPADDEPRIPAHWVRRIVLATVLAAAFYAVFAAFGDYRALRAQVADMALWTVAAALGLVVLGYLVRAVRWQLYLHHLGVFTPFRDELLVFLSGFAMGVTPGKMGEVVKAYYLREAHGTPYATSIPAVFAERVSDVVAVGALLAIGLFFVPSSLGLVLGAIGITGVVAGLLLLRSETFARLLLRLLGGFARTRRLGESIGRMHATLRPLLTGRLLLEATVLGLGGWAMEALAMSLLAHGFGVDLPWGVCAFVFAAANLLGAVSFLPGGLGATELGIVGLLVALGTAEAPATAITIAIRLCTLWFGVGLGLLAIGGLRAIHVRRTRALAG